MECEYEDIFLGRGSKREKLGNGWETWCFSEIHDIVFGEIAEFPEIWQKNSKPCSRGHVSCGRRRNPRMVAVAGTFLPEEFRISGFYPVLVHDRNYKRTGTVSPDGDSRTWQKDPALTSGKKRKYSRRSDWEADTPVRDHVQRS